MDRYMIVLAIDTCEVRGGVSILSDETVIHTIVHRTVEEYSSWLLPAVDALLRAGTKTMRDVDLYAVSAGPGSFTGVRIGLTTVKAWSEVFGRPIAAVSRLEVLAAESPCDALYTVSFVNAQRGQIFGAVYKRSGDVLNLLGQEMVAAPEDFIAWVAEQAGTERVAWVSTDPSIVAEQPAWKIRMARAEEILSVPCVLAPMIGRRGFQKALQGNVLDALSLDANYVRRSDAEIFWRCSPHAAAR